MTVERVPRNWSVFALVVAAIVMATLIPVFALVFSGIACRIVGMLLIGAVSMRWGLFGALAAAGWAVGVIATHGLISFGSIPAGLLTWFLGYTVLALAMDRLGFTSPRRSGSGSGSDPGSSSNNRRLSRRRSFQTRQIEALFRNSTDAIVLFDSRHRVVRINSRFTEVFGYNQEEIFGQDIDDFLVPRGMETESLALTAGVFRGDGVTLESRRRAKSGQLIDVSIKGVPVTADSRTIGGYGIYTDITDRKRAERDRDFKEKQLEALFKYSTDGIVLFDTEHTVVDINARFTEMFGFSPDEIKGQHIHDFLVPRSRRAEATSARTAIFEGEPVSLESVRKTRTGQAIDVQIKGIPVLVEGRIIGGYGLYTDITERKLYEQRLKHLSLHDALTGLHNWAYFQEELQRLNGGREYPISIIMADLNGLKAINDTFGHEVGDEVLKGCAEVLRGAVRKKDIVARIGGDEFALILPRTSEAAAITIQRRIMKNTTRFQELHPRTPLSFALGLSTTVDGSQSLFEVLREADSRMYHDKPACLQTGCRHTPGF